MGSISLPVWLGDHTLGQDAWANFNGSDWVNGHSRCEWTASLVYYIANGPWKVVERLGLSYKTTNELNHIIDEELPRHPPFKTQGLVIGGEHIQLQFRDIIPCIRALYGNPEFAHEMVFAPERHYTNAEKTHHIFNEMHTGDWWWSVQVSDKDCEAIKVLTSCPRNHLNQGNPVRQLSCSLFLLTKLSWLSSAGKWHIHSTWPLEIYPRRYCRTHRICARAAMFACVRSCFVLFS